ncbi:MAG: hypothetical protein IJH41_04385 [Eubacterium sp.]|nr:hypothetical protein [Eubacterium sp.]
MLHLDDNYIRAHMLDGMFGLEKENLRVTADGFFSHTPHPAPGDEHIVRDFSENQTEINTDPYPSAEEALAALVRHEQNLLGRLRALPEPEYLWLFSNPPYIKCEEDIPIAIFTGENAWKTEYRKHLSCVYGRYKMTFSGIHVNFSFSEELLRREAELRGIISDNDDTDRQEQNMKTACGQNLSEKTAGRQEPSEKAAGGQELIEDDDVGQKAAYRKFKDDFYIALTEKASYCGWLLTVLTAASPVIDGSFMGGDFDDTVDTRKASLRCSERGYWNFFDPVFDYSSLDAYADSIEKYVKSGDLMASSELYYPVRLKPNCAYSIEKLRSEGAGHIELRMFDLNPLVPEGIDVRDVKFAGYLLAYLAAGGRMGLTEEDQINVACNFKKAAGYDLDRVNLIGKGGISENVRDVAISIIEEMKQFYASMLAMPAVPEKYKEIAGILEFEESKLIDNKNRYAYKVLKEYGTDYVKKGMALVKERQR